MEKREGAAVRSGDNLSGYNLPGNCDNLPCIGGLNQFTNTKSPNLTTEFPSLALCIRCWDSWSKNQCVRRRGGRSVRAPAPRRLDFDYYAAAHLDILRGGGGGGGARGGEKEIAATAFCVSVRPRLSVRQSSGFIGGGGNTNWFFPLFIQAELLILASKFITKLLVRIPLKKYKPV